MSTHGNLGTDSERGQKKRLEKLKQASIFVWHYIRERPAAVIAFALGGGLGIFVCAPLMSWKLSSGASSAFGSALGALIGAGTAAVIADGIASRADRNARRTVARAIRPIIVDVDELRGYANNSTVTVGMFHSLLSPKVVEVDKALDRLDVLLPTIQQMKDGGGLGLADARSTLQRFKSGLVPILSALNSSRNNGYGTGSIVLHNTSTDLSSLISDTFSELYTALTVLGFPFYDVRDVYE